MFFFVIELTFFFFFLAFSMQLCSQDNKMRWSQTLNIRKEEQITTVGAFVCVFSFCAGKKKSHYHHTLPPTAGV